MYVGDPFSEEPFEIPAPGEFMVTVSARNCEGQSAVDEVSYQGFPHVVRVMSSLLVGSVSR